MSEPFSSVYGVLKVGSLAAVSGLALAIAAIETGVPSAAMAVLPSMDKMLVALFGMIFLRYVPSEKKVDGEFASLKVGQAEMLKTLMISRRSGKRVAKELKEHRLDLAGWMGRVDQNLATLNAKAGLVTHPVDVRSVVETILQAVEARAPKAPKENKDFGSMNESSEGGKPV